MTSSQIEAFGDEAIKVLLEHYSTLYSYLGGDPQKVRREWLRLKRYVTRTDTLMALTYREL